ncbi:Auxilliary activities family 12 protein [Periconia macrospinosa]|uniref:Auxilliary activities family 12 protein n=1 Tax=Periconia macrospinosa TaxID=97972 RepID=A0A2V1DUS3_9PLEO|nr:Auxilliary activities family 12 protein [Periconia macrospinosa]
MRCYTLSAAALIFSGPAFAQVKSKRYCDGATGICYAGVTNNNVLFGIAIPDVKTAPFDTVLQITSPSYNGWVGFSWGGTMPYVPLTVGWVNKNANTTIYSSRMAFGLSLPQPYADAEYTYLKGTGFNSTHWVLTVRCRGCSQWENTEGVLTSLDLTKESLTFAHGLATKAPAQPANNRSTFNVHSSFGHWSVDLSHGKNANFDKLVDANLVDHLPPPVTSTPSPTPTTTQSTTPTSIPVPTNTGIPSSCAGVSNFHSPVLTANGWKAVKVAGDLTQPRGLAFDSVGHLLVVQNGFGITAHTIGPDGCLTTSKTVIEKRNLNHAIVVSKDGKTLYASSATQAYAWDYDAATASVGSTPRIVVSGMDNKGHVTRSLAISPNHADLLIVSHGSNDNFDYDSANIKTGRSCIKAFNLTTTPTDGYNYARGGHQLGYGLRNGVGLAFDGNGMLWEVENSSDEIHRTINGTTTDIHMDNPAEELNYIGDPSLPNTQWYGYPTCYTVWSPSLITDTTFAVGDQFVLSPNATFADAMCASRSANAKLAFQAHSAPLDAIFVPTSNANSTSESLLVAFHGSWNRVPSTGYKIVEVPFTKGKDGEYVPSKLGAQQEGDTGSGYTDVLWNQDEGKCSTTVCFRPVAFLKDDWGRLYVSSDSGGGGEMLMLGRV